MIAARASIPSTCAYPTGALPPLASEERTLTVSPRKQQVSITPPGPSALEAERAERALVR